MKTATAGIRLVQAATRYDQTAQRAFSLKHANQEDWCAKALLGEFVAPAIGLASAAVALAAFARRWITRTLPQTLQRHTSVPGR